jgi:pimeloyl-ACP methyl ester carboxylesterase
LGAGVFQGVTRLAKQSKVSAAPKFAVRTRRAYFDFKFGQLHVRTAFPTTGGFDEQVTLICLHSREGSSRSFARFLPEIADERSVYAPDLPGFGESDAAPDPGYADAARAVLDLAADLRLRQIDLLGVRFGAAIALELGAARPDLVRKLVLVGTPTMDRIPAVKQPCLIVRVKPDASDDWSRGALPNARALDLGEETVSVFDSAPQTLAGQIAAFLKA